MFSYSHARLVMVMSLRVFLVLEGWLEQRRRQSISAAAVVVVAVAMGVMLCEIAASRHSVLHATAGAVTAPRADQTEGGERGS